MAAEYHWNEQPGDLLDLLDPTPLSTLDTDFDIFSPHASTSDTVILDASVTDLQPPVDASVTDLQAPVDVPNPFPSHPRPPIMSSNAVLDFPPLILPPMSDSSLSVEDPRSVPLPHDTTTTTTVPPVDTPQLLGDQVLEVSSPIDVLSPINVSSPIDGASLSEGDSSLFPPVQPAAAPTVLPVPHPSPTEANSSTHVIAASASAVSSEVTTNTTTPLSAVEAAKKAAEDFANSKVSERKRKLNGGSTINAPDDKRRKMNTTTTSDDDEEEGSPEQISHRKYQKRLQKNRDSAYVSRIRRRQYTKCLEDGLNRVEIERNELQSKYDALHHRFDVVMQELKTLKGAATAKFKDLATPVGAARLNNNAKDVGGDNNSNNNLVCKNNNTSSASNNRKKNAGVVITTMFMLTFIVGFIMPESLTNRSPFSAAYGNYFGYYGLGGSNTNNNINMQGNSNGNGGQGLQINYAPAGAKGKDSDIGRVWFKHRLGPAPPPSHWDNINNDDTLNTLTNNITQVFGGDNDGDLCNILQERIEMGGMSDEKLEVMKVKAQTLADNIHTAHVKRTLPSRRSLIFKKVVRKLANLADDCFTREVIALLTIRLLPTDNNNNIINRMIIPTTTASNTRSL